MSVIDSITDDKELTFAQCEEILARHATWEMCVKNTTILDDISKEKNEVILNVIKRMNALTKTKSPELSIEELENIRQNHRENNLH